MPSTQSVESCSVRVVDASVWVSVLVPRDVHHVASRDWLQKVAFAGDGIVVPSLLLAEVAGAIARRTGRPALGQRAIDRILAFPMFRVASVDERLGRAAARMAADRRLRGADAVYVALADQLGIPLITWDDEQISRRDGGIQVRTPDSDLSV